MGVRYLLLKYKHTHSTRCPAEQTPISIPLHPYKTTINVKGDNSFTTPKTLVRKRYEETEVDPEDLGLHLCPKPFLSPYHFPPHTNRPLNQSSTPSALPVSLSQLETSASQERTRSRQVGSRRVCVGWRWGVAIVGTRGDEISKIPFKINTFS